jgi:hypothetical protein
MGFSAFTPFPDLIVLAFLRNGLDDYLGILERRNIRRAICAARGARRLRLSGAPEVLRAR